MKSETIKLSLLLSLALLVGCSKHAHAQVSVAIAPDPHPQFLDSNGKPLSNGFLYTYTAGTTSNLNTYADSTGTVQNADPIPLDSTGAPSNGSVQTGIWLANASYNFCAYNAAMAQQWCTDNVSGYLGLLNLPNVWTFQQTFSLPIIDTATDNQLVLGQLGNQTTVDFPPPTGNVTLHMPITNDTMVGRATTDTLTNKTLALPLFNSSACAIVNGPGTYTCIANQNPTGTTLHAFAKLVNAPSQAQIADLTDTAGQIGICVSGCGNTGTATIQQSGGPVLCIFDGSVVAGDYVQLSSSIAGACHDAGALYPNGGQVLGRVLQTAAGVNNYSVQLFGPENAATGVKTICASGTPTTVNANVTSQQVIKTCPVPSGVLNSLGKSIRLTIQITINPGSVITSNGSWGLGTSSALGTFNNFETLSGSGATTSMMLQATCTVASTGATGSLSCSYQPSASPVGTAATLLGGGQIISSVDLTGPLYFGSGCIFSAGSVSNTCVGNQLILEQLN